MNKQNNQIRLATILPRKKWSFNNRRAPSLAALFFEGNESRI